MQRYELEDAKRSVEYMLDEIIKSLDVLNKYAADVGLQTYSTDMFLDEIKRKLYDFYTVFITAYQEQEHKIKREEEEKPEV
jgi:GH25 family lysozyme M1 (1,4-beta-N-acetylmuramidase)